MADVVFLARPGIDAKPFAGRLGPRKHQSFEHGPFRVSYVVKGSWEGDLVIEAGSVSVSVPLGPTSSVRLRLTVDGEVWEILSMPHHFKRRPPRFVFEMWEGRGTLLGSPSR